MISVHFQGKPFNITVIQVYDLISNAERAEVERFYQDLQDLLELTCKKDVLFIIGDRNANRKTRDTWSNRQIWSWGAKWSREEANRVLPKECTGHSKQSRPRTQEMILHMDIIHGHYSNQIVYSHCNRRWRNSIQSGKTRPGAACGSDHELLIAKFILKLKKVGKTTKPCMYDLNQIPYDYTVEVADRFKGLNLIECLKN